jgi:hypothetical protein
MNAALHREIACAIIIDTGGRFLLQQRDDISGILHPARSPCSVVTAPDKILEIERKLEKNAADQPAGERDLFRCRAIPGSRSTAFR